MISKIVLFLCVGVVLANPIKDTPEDLQEFFEDIDTQVKALHHETMIQIRSNSIPLETYIGEAISGINNNVTTAAKPYWATIRSLVETAQEKGQDISSCTNLGNSQLYDLNSTIIVTAMNAYGRYNITGNEILNASSSEAASVILELTVLEEVVALCKEETCATSLKKAVTQYYVRAKNALTDAETKSRSYTTEFLPLLLENYRLDNNLYVTNYTAILNIVTSCINNL